MEKPILLYDGDCGFCQWSVDQLKRRDPHSKFDYLPAHIYHNLTPKLEAQSHYEIILLQNGQEFGGADAALKLYCQLKPWSPLQLFRIPPFIWLARAVYRIVAKNRLTISRWLKLPTTCQLPTRK